MANKATITLHYKNEAGDSIINEVDVEGESLLNIETDDIAPLAQVEIHASFLTADLKAYALSVTKSKGVGSDLTTQGTLFTNSSNGAGGDTIALTLAAGKGFPGGPNLFTTDVTTLFFTNTGTGKCQFQLRALLSN